MATVLHSITITLFFFNTEVSVWKPSLMLVSPCWTFSSLWPALLLTLLFLGDLSLRWFGQDKTCLKYYILALYFLFFEVFGGTSTPSKLHFILSTSLFLLSWHMSVGWGSLYIIKLWGIWRSSEPFPIFSPHYHSCFRPFFASWLADFVFTHCFDSNIPFPPGPSYSRKPLRWDWHSLN